MEYQSCVAFFIRKLKNFDWVSFNIFYVYNLIVFIISVYALNL